MEAMEKQMDRNTILRTGMLQCSTCRDQETGLYISHCLNFDLMESGNTPDEAWGNLKAALKQYIEYCYTNYQEGMQVSADLGEWKNYAESLMRATQPPRIEVIHIELRPPLPEYEYPMWMQGVTGDGSTCSHVH